MHFKVKRKNNETSFPKLFPNKNNFNIYCPEDVTIQPGKYEVVDLKLLFEMSKDCIIVINPQLPCNIDNDGSDWNDSISISYNSNSSMVILYNLSDDEYTIHKGDLIGNASLYKKIKILNWNNREDENCLFVKGED